MSLPEHDAYWVVLASSQVDRERHVVLEDGKIEVCVLTGPARVGLVTNPQLNDVVDVGCSEGIGTGLLGEDVTTLVEGEEVAGRSLALAINGHAGRVLWVVETTQSVGDTSAVRVTSLVAL